MPAITTGRQEHPHHSREQIVRYLTDAEAIVGEAELDDELKVPAFLKVVDLLAAKQIVFEQTHIAGVAQRLGGPH
jgi:hypothetical protein